MFAVLDGNGKVLRRRRIDQEPGPIRAFLSPFPPGTPVALETVGNWYWIVDEIEEAGCVPHLAHAAKAKLMMGYVHTRAGYLRQDRQARRRRAGPLVAQRHAAPGVDPAGRTARRARA